MFNSEKQRSDQRACRETQDSGDGCGGRPHRGLKRKLPHFQVIDRRRVWLFSSFLFKYKKFGSVKKVQSRVLEVANHVDKVRLVLCSCSAETTLCWKQTGLSNLVQKYSLLLTDRFHGLFSLAEKTFFSQLVQKSEKKDRKVLSDINRSVSFAMLTC